MLSVQSCARVVTVAHHRVAAGIRGSARGWNADQFGRRLLPALSTAVSFGRSVWNGVGGSTGVVGTLLGPEGAGPVIAAGGHRPVVVGSGSPRPGPS